MKSIKAYVRPETGFVHYMYHKTGEAAYFTIPHYENLCWALSNFMTRTKEGVEEGKRLLTHLLAYQSPEGEFPTYLHEFPEVHDHFLGAYLFHPLYLIRKEFSHVMGKELSQKLEKTLTLLTDALLRRFQERNPQGHIRVKVGSALLAMGRSEGKEILATVPLLIPTSFHIADRELARDLGAVDLPLWPEVFWHSRLQTYAGPAYKERQEGDRPEITLLDLMMGAESERELTPHHLAYALVRSQPIPAREKSQGVHIGETYGWAALPQATEEEGFEPGFHLFRLITEGEGKVDTLAIPGGRYQKVDFVTHENGASLFFHFKPDFDSDSFQKSREIALYFNLGVKLQGSVFRLNEPLTLKFKTIDVTLEFRLKAGEGTFIGQRARGNRPSQLLKEGVYDEVLYLRTLRRSNDAVVELKITVS